MFRNGSGLGSGLSSGSRTQTTTQNATTSFIGNYNTIGTNNSQSRSQLLAQSRSHAQSQSQSELLAQTQTQSDDEIIFAIVTCNLNNLRRLVNSSNVNNIIDKKNKYTSLHHAVRIKKNDQIIEYLMSCGANPSIKQDEGRDAIDLSIESNYRYLIDRLLKDKDKELDNLYSKYDDLNYKVKGLDRTNQELTKTNEYLTKSTIEYVEKIESLKVENTNLKVENTNLKRKFDESEKAFSNLLKKTKKN